MKKINFKKNRFTESLELLLDIMCNTFGGVMFIALLLVIMSLTIKENNKIIKKVDPNLPLNINQLEMKIKALEIRKAKLITQKNNFIKNQKKNEKLKIFYEKKTEFELLQEDLKKLNTQINLIQAKNVNKKIEILRLINEKIEKQEHLLVNNEKIEKLKDKKIKITKALANYKLVGTKKTVELPVLRNVMKQPIFLHYLDDKIYLASSKKGDPLVGSGLITTAFNYDDFNFDFSDDLRYVEYSPKKGAGVPIANENDLRKLLNDYQQKTPKEAYFIWIDVNQNCMEKFCKYMHIFDEEGWKINWKASTRKKNFRIIVSFESYKSY